MLVSQDDLIGHQVPTSFAQIATSDPAWMERQWYTCHPVPDGDIMLMVGLGYYPNKNVMDAKRAQRSVITEVSRCSMNGPDAV